MTTLKEIVEQDRVSIKDIWYLARERKLDLDGRCGIGMVAKFVYQGQSQVYQLTYEPPKEFYFKRILGE